VIQNAPADADLHQKLITSRGSPLAQAYHVWLMSIAMFMSYPAHRITDRTIVSETIRKPPLVKAQTARHMKPLSLSQAAA